MPSEETRSSEVTSNSRRERHIHRRDDHQCRGRAFRPAPAQTRSPRRRASRAPRPLARGRCPPPLNARRTADATAAWATAMRPGAVEVGDGADVVLSAGSLRAPPWPGAAHRELRRTPALDVAWGRSSGGQAICARIEAELGRGPCALASSGHQPLAHRASGLGPGDTGRFLDPTRAAPLRAPSCPWRAQ